jgi:hypothetical protein
LKILVFYWWKYRTTEEAIKHFKAMHSEFDAFHPRTASEHYLLIVGDGPAPQFWRATLLSGDPKVLIELSM